MYVWCTWQLVTAIHGKGDGWTFWVTFSRSLLPLILVILVSILSHSTTCGDFSVISWMCVVASTLMTGKFHKHTQKLAKIVENMGVEWILEILTLETD